MGTIKWWNNWAQLNDGNSWAQLKWWKYGNSWAQLNDGNKWAQLNDGNSGHNKMVEIIGQN